MFIYGQDIIEQIRHDKLGKIEWLHDKYHELSAEYLTQVASLGKNELQPFDVAHQAGAAFLLTLLTVRPLRMPDNQHSTLLLRYHNELLALKTVTAIIDLFRQSPNSLLPAPVRSNPPLFPDTGLAPHLARICEVLHKSFIGKPVKLAFPVAGQLLQRIDSGFTFTRLPQIRHADEIIATLIADFASIK
jgi:hypothetical protein